MAAVITEPELFGTDLYRDVCSKLIAGSKRPKGPSVAFWRAFFELVGNKIALDDNGLIIQPGGQVVADEIGKHTGISFLTTDGTYCPSSGFLEHLAA